MDQREKVGGGAAARRRRVGVVRWRAGAVRGHPRRAGRRGHRADRPERRRQDDAVRRRHRAPATGRGPRAPGGRRRHGHRAAHPVASRDSTHVPAARGVRHAFGGGERAGGGRDAAGLVARAPRRAGRGARGGGTRRAVRGGGCARRPPSHRTNEAGRAGPRAGDASPAAPPRRAVVGPHRGGDARPGSTPARAGRIGVGRAAGGARHEPRDGRVRSSPRARARAGDRDGHTG